MEWVVSPSCDHTNCGKAASASLAKAEKVEGGYKINGTKTWTTMAHFADMMFILVRTNSDCKPQEGISFMLLDMKSPGVSVKPIITLDGSHYINMVYLEDVFIQLTKS